MKKKIIPSLSILLSSVIVSQAFAINSTEVPAIIKLLTSDKILVSSKDNVNVPLSYYVGEKSDITNYFGNYLCGNTNKCDVVDSLYANPYAILGKGLPPQQGTPSEKEAAQYQIERTDMQYGADIYDAATWQIALALAASHGEQGINSNQAIQDVNNENIRITNKKNRATGDAFKYGYNTTIKDDDYKNAFTFRLLATNFTNKDPFVGTNSSFEKGITCDSTIKDCQYVTTWSDWKPILGENAWAQLIGPIQANYLLQPSQISLNDIGLQNAMNTLVAFSAMQTPAGAFYYAPGGSLGNQGPIPQGEISIENNMSLLGGLTVLKDTLTTLQKTSTDPSVAASLQKINIMLNGGIMPNGVKTYGLYSFIYNSAFNKKTGRFYSGGTYSESNGWVPAESNAPADNAVDVNTWGIAALGPNNIDNWFGKGVAYNIWQKVKQQAGYFNSTGDFMGVGYTLSNPNGGSSEIMSAEWTSGAITAVQALLDYYTKNPDSSVSIDSLKKDLSDMESGIENLRNDKYLAANFTNAVPADKFVALNTNPTVEEGYLYASERYAIPFGWNANPLISTTSSSWVIMNIYQFNPFQPKGALYGLDIPTPSKVTPTPTPSTPATLPQKVDNLIFDAGDLRTITQLSLSYKINPTGEYIVAATINGRNGTASVPKGTSMLSIAYNNNGWVGACIVKRAGDICQDASCDITKMIKAKWSSDGQGACNLT